MKGENSDCTNIICEKQKIKQISKYKQLKRSPTIKNSLDMNKSNDMGDITSETNRIRACVLTKNMK